VFWQLPELAKVQFPWRLLIAVDFALITALCLAPLLPLGRAKVYLCAAAVVALAPGVILAMALAPRVSRWRSVMSRSGRRT